MLCEASGNINLKTIKDVAEPSVGIISCGPSPTQLRCWICDLIFR
jgi:nicotinate-nucleotide pyrophosphorylase